MSGADDLADRSAPTSHISRGLPGWRSMRSAAGGTGRGWVRSGAAVRGVGLLPCLAVDDRKGQRFGDLGCADLHAKVFFWYDPSG